MTPEEASTRAIETLRAHLLPNGPTREPLDRLASQHPALCYEAEIGENATHYVVTLGMVSDDGPPGPDDEYSTTIMIGAVVPRGGHEASEVLGHLHAAADITRLSNGLSASDLVLECLRRERP